VTITAAAGVTINGTPLTLATSKGGSLVRTASNTWTFTPIGGGGKVLQVVRATDTTSRSTTSTSFVDASLSVTITPTATTSTIILIQTGYGRLSSSTAGNVRVDYQITDSSNVAISGAQHLAFGPANFTFSGPGSFDFPFTFVAFASPATISAVTYKSRFLAPASTTTNTIINTEATGQMLAIEVAA